MDTAMASMTPLVDLHTHILPGIDDGARDVDEAADMLAALSRQQVDTVVLTPHYLSDEMPMEEFCRGGNRHLRRCVAEQGRSLPG